VTDLATTGNAKQGLAGIEIAVARNRDFADAGKHEDASLIPTLRLLVLTCLDGRVDPAHILGLDLSDALVLRNNGGRVTAQVIDDVAYISALADVARPEGPLFEIAVVHHTECGAARLADDGFRSQYAERIGVEESALRGYAVVDPAATVAADIERLRNATSISPRMSVSGHVYDVGTGLIETIVPAQPVGPTDGQSALSA
jgi:carbonic anhydrase